MANRTNKELTTQQLAGMDRTQLESLNEDQLAQAKELSKLEVADSPTQEDNVAVRPAIKKIDTAPLDTSIKSTHTQADINKKRQELSKTSLPDSEQKEKLNNYIREGRVSAVPATVDNRSERRKRQEENANKFIESVFAREQELGRALTKQEIADLADVKGLWAYQSLNNPKGNWGNAFGARGYFGTLNDDTYNQIRSDLDSRSKAQKQNEKRDAVVAHAVPFKDRAITITKGMQDDMKKWGNLVQDRNNIPPELVEQLYTKLNGLGIETPAVSNEPVSLDTILYNLGGDADDVMEVLGFYDGDASVIPHTETFEEMMARRERAEEQMLLNSQQKELDRQKSRAGLADLAAGVGDIIKASNGAFVGERDYKAIYDNLTEQQKTNYNNYLARMNALKEEEKAKQRLAEERAYNEKLLREERAFQAEQSRLDRGWKGDENQANRDLEWAIANLDSQTALAGKLNAEQIKAAKETINVPVGGKTFKFASKEASEAAIQAMHGILWDVLIAGDGKYREPYGTMMSSLAGDGITKEGQLRAVVNAALSSPAVLNNEQLLKRVHAYLTQASIGTTTQSSGTTAQSSGTTAQSSGTTAQGSGATAQGSVDTQMYKGRNGQLITKAQYDALPEPMKNNYVLVTQ